MRINDISVSRLHAIIKCKKDGFYIEDNTSKFGTIILLKDKLRLKAHHTMAVQVGRTVISFTIKYVQSERDKLRSEVTKVLDSKNKSLKPVGPIVPKPAPQQELDPMMQATGYQPNVPMLNEAAGDQGYQEEVDDEENVNEGQQDNMGYN